MINRKMNQQYAAAAKQATCFVTLNGSRYEMFFARNFEGKLNIKTKEVPALGTIMNGRKAVGAEGKFKLTIYRVTDKFSEVALTYIETGVLPEFEIQVTEEDPSTPIGRSTKIYSDCMIGGDVLLSVADDGENFIEQTIEGYFGSVKMPEKYTDPEGM